LQGSTERGSMKLDGQQSGIVRFREVFHVSIE